MKKFLTAGIIVAAGLAATPVLAEQASSAQDYRDGRGTHFQAGGVTGPSPSDLRVLEISRQRGSQRSNLRSSFAPTLNTSVHLGKPREGVAGETPVGGRY